MNDLILSVLAYSVENNHDMKLILILLSVGSCCPIQVSVLIVVPCLLWKWIIFVPWTPFLIFSTDYNISAWPDLSDAPQIATIAACLDHCIDHLLCCEGIHQHCTLLIGIYSLIQFKTIKPKTNSKSQSEKKRKGLPLPSHGRHLLLHCCRCHPVTGPSGCTY